MRTHRILAGVVAVVIGVAMSNSRISADEKAKPGTKEDFRHSQHFWDCAKPATTAPAFATHVPLTA